MKASSSIRQCRERESEMGREEEKEEREKEERAEWCEEGREREEVDEEGGQECKEKVVEGATHLGHGQEDKSRGQRRKGVNMKT